MVGSVLLGFIWYGPLFGKKWMALSNIHMPEEKPSFSVMIKPIILSFIGSALMTFTLASSIVFHDAFYQTAGLVSALGMAFLLWLGFIVPVYFNFAGWEGKSWTLFFINTGYWFVFLALSATVIVALGY